MSLRSELSSHNTVSEDKEEKMEQKTVVFDFDGVIHSYTSGWKGVDVIPDPPVDGIGDAIRDLYKLGYKVVVVSARCAEVKGMIAVKKYLSDHGILVDYVSAEKPPAVCYIDDRAIRFEGDASTIVEQVTSFRSWTDGVSVLPLNVEEAIKKLKAMTAALRVEPGETVDLSGIAKLRPCRATRYYKGETYEVKGWFHGWAADFEEFEAGPGNVTLAIIEQEDGSVVTCQPDTVQFLDGGAPHHIEMMMKRGGACG